MDSENIYNTKYIFHKNKHDWQYYYNDKINLNIEEEAKRKFENELNASLEQAKVISKNKDNEGILNNEFVDKMIKMINDSFNKEKFFYQKVGIPHSGSLNIRSELSSKGTLESKSGDGILTQTKEFVKKLNMEVFGSEDKNTGAIQFLSLFNDSEFLSYITAKAITFMSFTTYGREKGKAAGREQWENIFKNYFDKEKPKAEIRSLLQNSFFEKISEGYEDKANDIINTFLDSRVGQILEKNGIRVVGENFEKKSNSLDNWDKMLKDSIKEIYKEMEIEFSNELKDKFLVDLNLPRAYLGKALVIGTDMKDTLYGQMMNSYIYIKDEKGKSRFNENKPFRNFVNEFTNDLYEWMISFTKGKKKYEKANNYLVNETNLRLQLKKGIFEFYRTGNDEQDIKNFSQWNKANVSGVLGEICAAYVFKSKHSKDRVFIQANELDKLGNKEAVDIVVKEYTQEGKGKKSYGIQVKNYTSSNSVTVYKRDISLKSEEMTYYFSQKELELLRYLVANKEFGEKKIQISNMNKIITEFLYLSTPNFMRISQANEPKELEKNNFFFINNKIYPSSYILMVLLNTLVNQMQDNNDLSKIQKPLFKIQGYPDYPKDFPPLRISENLNIFANTKIAFSGLGLTRIKFDKKKDGVK